MQNDKNAEHKKSDHGADTIWEGGMAPP